MRAKRNLVVVLGFLLLFCGLGPAQSSSSSAAPPPQSSQASAGKPSAQEIASAKAAHKVWVNLETGIYHKGGRWYGKTKNGKFMTVDEAKKAGYKPAKRD